MIPLSTLLERRQVTEAMAQFLTLRDIFKMGLCCRELMNRLIVEGPRFPDASQDAAANR